MYYFPIGKNTQPGQRKGKKNERTTRCIVHTLRDTHHTQNLAKTLMNILPYEHILYDSDLSLEEVIKKLNLIVEPPKLFRLSGLKEKMASNKYEGELKEDSFKINRIVNYRTSLLPIVQGKIKQIEGRTTLKLKMRLNYFSLIFMIVWFGGIGTVCGKIIASNIEYQLLDVVPFAMFVFPYFIILLGFKNEVDKTKKDLTEYLNLKEKKAFANNVYDS